jgi:glutaminase|tara:strand:- start:249 stop:1076 length:828 start_codon:yes stop_codon:yes gene_type:complete
LIQDGSKPIWFKKEEDIKKQEIKPKKFSIFVATPVFDNVSIHYFNACLEFQKHCVSNNIQASFQVMKSSLVTQGRNLCVSSFMESNHTHLLFVDSDIEFQTQSVFKMIASDKDVISVPYPLKQIFWDKAWERISKGNIKNAKDLKFKGLYSYPMKVEDEKNILIKDGVIEVTHSPTGCMLIKREVIEKMIKAYPETEIVQKTVINGELMNRPYMYNLFDTLHDPKTKRYLGEDFAFCKRWKDIGGLCHALITDRITHAGEHQYRGCFADELIKTE